MGNEKESVLSKAQHYSVVLQYVDGFTRNAQKYHFQRQCLPGIRNSVNPTV